MGRGDVLLGGVKRQGIAGALFAALTLLSCVPSPTRAAPAPPSGAQPAATPGAAELDLQEQAPATRNRRTDLFAAPEAAPCPFAGSSLTFTLSTLDVQGSTRLTKADITGATRGLTGSRVPVTAICEIRDRLGRALFRRGVLARVEAPPQTVSEGRLKLLVIEARIVAVHVHGEIGPAQSKAEAWSTTSPASGPRPCSDRRSRPTGRAPARWISTSSSNGRRSTRSSLSRTPDRRRSDGAACWAA
jgi:hemolysin activation/secretion protein